MKRFIFTTLLLIAILLSSCFQPEDEIILDGTPKLVIDNAFYTNDLFSCSIQFDYYTTEDTCNIGGWGIDWQDGRTSSINWYMMQKCYPGVRYTISKECKSWAILPPIVGMHGYPLHENDTFTTLYATDTMQAR